MLNKINVTVPNEFGAPAKMQVVPADWLPDRLAMITLEGKILGWLELAGGFWKLSYRTPPFSVGEPTEIHLETLPVTHFTNNNAVAVWACGLVLEQHSKTQSMKAGDSLV